MKKLTTKLMISVLSVALAFIALGTSTFAWFSMNTEVEATGMQLTAVSATNLLISNDGTTPYSNTCEADEDFGTHRLFPASAVLVPGTDTLANIATGKYFNAVQDGQMFGTNGEGGAAKNGETKMKASGVAALSDSADGYYAVYDFYLKSAANENDPELDVYLKTLTIANKTTYAAVYTAAHEDDVTTIESGWFTFDGVDTYTAATAGDTVTADETYYVERDADLTAAARVAMFVGDTLKAVYDKTGVASNTKNGIAKRTYAADDLFATGDLQTQNINVLNNTTNFKVGTDAVTVTLVVWLEGEDAVVVNANAAAALTIDIEFAVIQ